jgi:dihydrofolate reductase
MRRLRYSVAATLDGFIADPNGGYDWIIMDEAIDFATMFDEFDTFVMGRKTWDVSASADVPGVGDMFGGKDVIVFSRTLKSARPGVRIVSTSPVDTVRELKQKPGKDIWLFGGGSMFRTLADAGLVDTVEVAIMPVLLSQGVPLIAPGARITGMKLDKCETLPKSGIVMMSYTIQHS